MTAGRSHMSLVRLSLAGLILLILKGIIMIYEIQYSDVYSQILKLREQGLVINDEEKAVEYLKYYGYSNLVKSYRDPYVVNTDDGKKKYRSGVTFEQVASLHELDKNIRNAVMAAMQDLEEYTKEQSANVIASAYGTNQEEYLKYRNYQNKRKTLQRFRLASIIDKLREQVTSSKDPIYHYYTKYQIVPPWILFKSLYFSTIINFIDLFKVSEQTELMKSFLLYDEYCISEDAARKLMMDILFVAMEYRNNAAHGGRMYDFAPKNKIRAGEIWGEAYSDLHPRFTEFIELLKILKYQNPYLYLKEVLESEVNKHCEKFPQDVTYLGQLLNIDIIPCNIVYVSNKSRKIHQTPNCSGVKNPIVMEYDEALNNGCIECKRCMNII